MASLIITEINQIIKIKNNQKKCMKYKKMIQKIILIKKVNPNSI